MRIYSCRNAIDISGHEPRIQKHFDFDFDFDEGGMSATHECVYRCYIHITKYKEVAPYLLHPALQ
jgi:hypothetical protein